MRIKSKGKLIGFLAIALLLIFLIAMLTGCMQQGINFNVDNPWMFYKKDQMIGTIMPDGGEVLEYNVSLNPDFNPNNNLYYQSRPRLKGNGTYTSTITWINFNTDKKFLITTSLVMDCWFEDKDGNKISDDFQAKTNSTVEMLDATRWFLPLKSKTTTQTKHIWKNGDEYKIVDFNYQQVNEYQTSEDGKTTDLNISLNMLNSSTGEYTNAIPDSENFDLPARYKKQNYSFNNITENGTIAFFDNASLFYALRGISDLNQSTSNPISISVDDILTNGRISRLSASSKDTNTTQADEKNPKYTVNGKTVEKKTNIVNLTSGNTTNQNAISFFYSTKKESFIDRDKCVRSLISFKQAMFVYQLQKFNSNFIETDFTNE